MAINENNTPESTEGIAEILDDLGIGFAMTSHHPMTHLDLESMEKDQLPVMGCLEIS